MNLDIKNFLPILVYDSSLPSQELRVDYELDALIYLPLFYIPDIEYPFSTSFYRSLKIAQLLRRYPLVIQTAEIDFLTKRELLTGIVEKFPKGGVLLDTQLGAIPSDKERLMVSMNANSSWLFTELETCNPETFSNCLSCVCREFLNVMNQDSDVKYELITKNR